MREDIAIYRTRVKSFQMTVLIIMVIVLVSGGCVFGLGVQMQPILRITRPESFHHVKWILDMMIGAGLAQLTTSGLNCFATCWKMIWPLYLAIGLTAMTVVLELGAIATSLHLLHAADSLANEDIVHPWYWVECKEQDSCHAAMLGYMYYYVMPQIVLCSIAMFLQCLGILTMGRTVRTVAEHMKVIENYKIWYRDRMEQDDVDDQPDSEGDVKTSIEMTPFKEINSEGDTGSEKSISRKSYLSPVQLDTLIAGTPNPNYHTPSSILKVDHGYVAASGGSLNYADMEMEMRNRKEKERLTGTPSISFKADVQVHYYDENESPETQQPSKHTKSPKFPE